MSSDKPKRKELQVEINRLREDIQTLRTQLQNQPPLVVVDGVAVEAGKTWVEGVIYEMDGLKSVTMASHGPWPLDWGPGLYIVWPHP